MSATRLLVLGLVRAFGRTHGYVISKQLLGWRVDVWANTKTGSIYHALRALTKEGHLLALDVASSDLGPPRTEYEITPSGSEEYFSLMREAIAVPDSRPDMLCSGLVFLTSLTRHDAIALFEQRVETFIHTQSQIDADLKSADKLDPAQLPPHMESLSMFWVHWAASGRQWSEQMLATLRGGAYAFAGEPNSSPIHRPLDSDVSV